MRYIVIVLIFFLVTACGERTAETHSTVVLISEVQWEQLNPARGDQSPKAGTLWGDRSGTGPTGFLLKPVDGFKSPPHIHNVSYRGVVIRGLIHNDDPNADNMWMPAGSFWTQPKGAVHITSARGDRTLAYIEIEQGPYLVKPKNEAFDSGERPLNVDKSNLVWLDASDRKLTSGHEPRISFLWVNPEEKETLYGVLVKIPAGFSGKIKSRGSSFRAVIIQGRLQYLHNDNAKTLEPGSYFSSKGKSEHRLSSQEESSIYVRTNGRLDIH